VVSRSGQRGAEVASPIEESGCDYERLQVVERGHQRHQGGRLKARVRFWKRGEREREREKERETREVKELVCLFHKSLIHISLIAMIEWALVQCHVSSIVRRRTWT
jgi:hypothetical protein